MRSSKSQPGTGRLSLNRSDPKDTGKGIVYRSLPAQTFRIGDGAKRSLPCMPCSAGEEGASREAPSSAAST